MKIERKGKWPVNDYRLSTISFVLIFAFFNALLYHYPLALYSFENIEYNSINGARTLFTLTIIVYAVTAILLFILSLLSNRILKLFTVFSVIGNSLALYFITTYQIILDKSMMGNIFNTRAIESTEFIHSKLFIYLIFLGIFPAILIIKTQISKVRRIRVLGYILIMISLLLGCIYINSSTTLWFDKHSKKLGGVILPWSYLINSARVKIEHSKKNVVLSPLPSPTSIKNNRTIIVLVIGETARAANFSLYGYDRQTNPLISTSDAIALQNVTACSTYTTASIHCMLSHDGSTRGSFESLPSYLQKNGVEVIWRTRNWGEPAITVEEYSNNAALRQSCSGSQCDYDEVLLTGLSSRIRSSNREKVLVVLHTKGSHGPSYYSRYPENFEVFKPVCKSVELNKCTPMELINAYDNTIVYTDHFLQQTINELKSINDIPTAMIYISDHGESLGEFGLYLHGTPNALAPAVQLEIPFIVWMSEKFKILNSIESQQFTKPEYSHDNIFHSILGAFGIQSTIYKKSMDIFNTR